MSSFTGTCTDNRIYENSDVLILSWYVSYSAARQIQTSNTSATALYEEVCVEKEFSVSFGKKINTVVTFQNTESLLNLIEQTQIVNVDMVPCDTFGEFRLEYSVFMKLHDDSINGSYTYVPLAVQPANQTCHYKQSDTDLLDFSTNNVVTLTDRSYLFNLETSCRAIADGVDDAFQYCRKDDSSKFGISQYGINIQFQRGFDTAALIGEIEVLINYKEEVQLNLLGKTRVQGTLDLWRVSSQTVSGYEKIEISNTTATKIRLNEDIFTVLYFITDDYDAVQTTRFLNYENETFDGFKQIDPNECIPCSLEGCFKKNEAGSFGAFAREYYQSGTTTREHVYRHIQPVVPRDNIQLNLTAVLKASCDVTNGRRRLNSVFSADFVADVTVKAVTTRSVMYDFDYYDLITSQKDVDKIFENCEDFFQIDGAICSDVGINDDGKFVLVLEGTDDELADAVIVVENSTFFLNEQNIVNNAAKTPSSSASTFVFQSVKSTGLTVLEIVLTTMTVSFFILVCCYCCCLAVFCKRRKKKKKKKKKTEKIIIFF